MAKLQHKQKGSKTMKKTPLKKGKNNKAKKKPLLENVRSRFQRLSRVGQMAVFGIVFAAIGGGYYLYQSLASDGLPTGANELVISYEVGMNHQYFEDNFPTGTGGMPLLLYGNGLMLCSNTMTMDPADHSMDNMPSWNSRQLSSDEIRSLVDKVKSAGFDKAASYQSNDELHYPGGAGRFIRINTTQGFDQAATYPNYPDTGFTAAENVLKAECAKTTTAYVPEKTEAQTILLSSDSPEATQAIKELPAGLDVDTEPKQVKNKEFKGKDAKALKAQLKKTPELYKQGDKVVRARYVDRIPEWNALKPKQKSSKGKVSAAADLHTRWMIVLASSQTAPNWATTATASDDATNIRNWYAGKFGKNFDISSVRVVRGNKTAAQYRTCPSGAACQGSSSLAALINLEREYPLAGYSTNFITAFEAGGGCNGWGDAPGINDGGAAAHGVYALTNAGPNGCTWQKGKRVVAAHEAGHTFGLQHTCNGTLMDGGGCPGPATWPYTTLDGGQAAALSAYSPFFNSFAAPTPPPPPAPTCPSTMGVGGVLGTGQTLQSPDCGIRLVMQTDGNLVVYSRLGHAIWASGSRGSNSRLALQTDYNLVVRNGAGTAQWASGTKGSGGTQLRVQNDGNVVLYSSAGAVWATHTAGDYNK